MNAPCSAVGAGNWWWSDKVSGRGWPSGGFACAQCEDFNTIIQHALPPLNDVRRIDVRNTAAGPDMTYCCVGRGGERLFKATQAEGGK